MTAPEPAPPRFDLTRVLVWCVVAAVVSAVVAGALLLPRRESAPPDSVPAGPPQRLVEVPEEPGPPPPTTGLFERPIGGLPDVSATERSGREMRTSELLGKWLVLDFVFASCGGTCPQLQSAMARLQEDVRADPEVRLVSVSVDPARDTPERLASWADGIGADRARWLFLRLAPDDLRRLMKDGLKVPTPDDLVMHSNLFLLLGPEGTVRGRYAPLDHANWREVLLADLAKLRAEAAR